MCHHPTILAPLLLCCAVAAAAASAAEERPTSGWGSWENSGYGTKDEAFEEWLKSRGGAVSGARVQLDSLGQRGVVATRALPPGWKLATMPFGLAIGVEHVLEHKVLGPLVGERGGKEFVAAWLGDVEAIALLLSYERRMSSNSGWAPWLAMLPDAEHMQLPLLWSKPTLERLRGSPGGSRLAGAQRRARATHAKIMATAPLAALFPGTYSFEEHALSMQHALSRIYGLTVGGYRTRALMPFADFFNTGAAAGVNVQCRTKAKLRTSDGPEALECLSTRKLAAGEQLLVQYGTGTDQTQKLGQGAELPNSVLLLEYGFAMGGTQHDALNVALPRYAKELNARAFVLGVSDQQSVLLRNGDNNALDVLVCRIALADANSPQFVRQKVATTSANIMRKKLSDRILRDEAAGAGVAKFVQGLLDGYSSGSKSKKEPAASISRLLEGERRVLQGVLSLIRIELAKAQEEAQAAAGRAVAAKTAAEAERKRAQVHIHQHKDLCGEFLKSPLLFILQSSLRRRWPQRATACARGRRSRRPKSRPRRRC